MRSGVAFGDIIMSGAEFDLLCLFWPCLTLPVPELEPELELAMDASESLRLGSTKLIRAEATQKVNDQHTPQNPLKRGDRGTQHLLAK